RPIVGSAGCTRNRQSSAANGITREHEAYFVPSAPPTDNDRADCRCVEHQEQAGVDVRIAVAVHRGMNFRFLKSTADTLAKMMTAEAVSTVVEPEKVISGRRNSRTFG